MACGCVPIVDGGGDIGLQSCDQPLEFRQLVLSQGLGREQVQRPVFGLVQQPVEDRQVVAQRLARGRWGDDDDVLPSQHGCDCLGLVGVEQVNAAGAQRQRQPPIQLRWEGSVTRCSRRQSLPGRDMADEAGVELELLQKRVE